MINFVLDAPSLNAGRASAMTDFNFASLETARIGGVGSAYPGLTFPFQGNLYQVVQNRNGSSLAVGDIVSLYMTNANRTGNSTGASTKAILTTDDTLDAGLRGARDWPGYVHTTTNVLATTAAMQRREIRGNSIAAAASTITVSEYLRELGPNFDATSSPEAYATTPDANWDYSVFCGWDVMKADSGAQTTKATQGVVISTTIGSNNFGIIQLRGLAMANVDGTVDLAAGDPIRVGTGGTAAVFVKHTYTGGGATGPEALNGLYVAGMIIDPYTNDGVGLRGVILTGAWALHPFPITL